jgi:hypothetical protein
MYEYKCEEIRSYGEDTENRINCLAVKGWELVCSYSGGYWLIFKRKRNEEEHNDNKR